MITWWSVALSRSMARTIPLDASHTTLGNVIGTNGQIIWGRASSNKWSATIVGCWPDSEVGAMSLVRLLNPSSRHSGQGWELLRLTQLGHWGATDWMALSLRITARQQAPTPVVIDGSLGRVDLVEVHVGQRRLIAPCRHPRSFGRPWSHTERSIRAIARGLPTTSPQNYRQIHWASEAHAWVLVALLQGLHIGEDIRPLPRRIQAGETRRGPFNKSLGIC